MPIFDQGYQHWKGPLTGHAWRWLAITRHGVRAQLRNRFVRLLLLVAWLPAIALIAVLAVWGLLEQQAESVLNFLKNMLPPEMIAKPSDYRIAVWTIAYSFFFKAELFCCMFLVLIVGPNLVSRDLRFNAFPLYFSRPLRRWDYFLGKLGVIGFFLAAVAILPAVMAYVLGVLFSLDLGVVKDTFHLLWASIVYGLIVVVSAGSLMLALSSLSRRSIYVGLTWVGLWIISTTVASLLMVIHRETIIDGFRNDEVSQWSREHARPKGDWKTNKEEWERYNEAQFKAFMKARAKGEAAWSQEAPRDWRPLCSYTSNLDRLADFFLDTDSAWVTIGRTIERPRQMAAPMMNPRDRARAAMLAEQPPNDRRLADQIVPQYPWYWSAGVLAGVLLLSIWILTFRVRTLDRLK
jgi:ABC-2 type transport system permease protein